MHLHTMLNPLTSNNRSVNILKKKILATVFTALLSISFLLSASALTDEESIQRKRAYYAGIDSTISLLSAHLGDLHNASINRIVITSLQDFTSEDAVKEAVLSESGKLGLSSVEVSIQFSAQDGETIQDYLFDHYLSFGSTYTLAPLSKSSLSTHNYNYAITYFSDYSTSIGNGIAHTTVFGSSYYLDIDLLDYSNCGYSLFLPIAKSSLAPDTTLPLQETVSTESSSESSAAISDSTPTAEEFSLQLQPPSSTPKVSSADFEVVPSSIPSSSYFVPSSAYEKVGLLVWIPTNGGKRYHSNSSCSGMINPRRVDLGEARYLGFTACGRCYR